MRDILNRIETCNFNCEAGPLTHLLDWKRLKKLIESPDYTPVGQVTAFGVMMNRDRIPVGTELYTTPQLERFSNYQGRVGVWVIKTFQMAEAKDIKLRSHRFLEEALELSQTTQTTRSEAHKLVDYVYDRPIGVVAQEAGGVMVTLSALCSATEVELRQAAEMELARVWEKQDVIRKKNTMKPNFDDPQYKESTWVGCLGEFSNGKYMLESCNINPLDRGLPKGTPLYTSPSEDKLRKSILAFEALLHTKLDIEQRKIVDSVLKDIR